MLMNLDDVNRLLSEMRDEGMVEPIDDSTLNVDFWDWADVIGIVDEFEPQEMVDESGEVWYVS
jgi:hypothetical protein